MDDTHSVRYGAKGNDRSLQHLPDCEHPKRFNDNLPACDNEY